MCGINRDLWDLGFEHFRGGSAMACTVCISEVAENFGWGPLQPLQDAIVSRETEIAELRTQLATVPDLTEGFINGVRNSLTDFVFAVSSIGSGNSREAVSSTIESSGADVEGDKSAGFSPEALSESTSVKRSTSVPADPDRNRPGRPRKIH
jgi:hypothetical protein